MGNTYIGIFLKYVLNLYFEHTFLSYCCILVAWDQAHVQDGESSAPALGSACCGPRPAAVLTWAPPRPKSYNNTEKTNNMYKFGVLFTRCTCDLTHIIAYVCVFLQKWTWGWATNLCVFRTGMRRIRKATWFSKSALFWKQRLWNATQHEQQLNNQYISYLNSPYSVLRS